MDWYTVFKFLHVSAAIIWIGGAFIMLMFGIKAMRSRNDTELVAIVQQVGWAAERIYVPASIVTVLLGIVVATLGSLWSELWVSLGLVGMVVTIGLGVLALTPRAKQVAAAAGVTPEAVAMSRELITLVKFDCALLFIVVADMVLKPSSSDYAVLVVMAIVLVGAAALWVLPTLRRRPAVA